VPDWPLGSHELPLRLEADRSPAGMARLIADAMEALDLQDVTLVGNDSGGALCQMVVTRHPERVGRLVLTDCDAFDNFPPRMFNYLLWASRVPVALAMVLQGMRLRFVRQAPIAYGWLTKRPLPPGVSDAYALPILRDAGVRRDAAKFMVGLHKSDLDEVTEQLSDFRRPVLIAWAPEDRFFPFEHGERLASIFPDSRLERIEDSRTFVPEDQPKRLAELIAGFVREPAPAAAT
jgi:pimeloyl-ACP methyl ester carboxylesterase